MSSLSNGSLVKAASDVRSRNLFPLELLHLLVSSKRGKHTQAHLYEGKIRSHVHTYMPGDVCRQFVCLFACYMNAAPGQVICLEKWHH